jgi:hypothetical protein
MGLSVMVSAGALKWIVSGYAVVVACGALAVSFLAYRQARKTAALSFRREGGGPEMFYSVDRSGLYQTGRALDLWQQDPVLGRPFWRLPDWFEANDLRTHVAELFPDGLSLHGWQYMVERHDFIRPTNSDALFVNHNMVVELVFEYVRRAVFPSRRSRFQSFFGWESIEMARAFRKEGQALYRVESSSIFRADQSWLTLGVQNAIASLSAHRYWSGAPSGTPRWEILLAPPVRVMERID